MNRLFIVLSLVFCLCEYQLHSEEFNFTENLGQWSENVAYRSDLPGGVLYFENSKWTYFLYKLPHGHGEPVDPIHDNKAHAFTVEFKGANMDQVIQGESRQRYYKNFFLGNDPEKWAGHVGVYNVLRYEEIYDDIDLKLYSNAEGMKYDFEVQAGADPREIKIQYDHLDGVTLEDGKLQLHHRFGYIEEQTPFAYQYKNGVLCEVECAFTLRKNEVSFELGEYDPDFNLTIDPALIFSTYTGSTGDNWGSTATFDNFGNTYGGGIVFTPNYPTTMGAFDLTLTDGGNDSTTDMGISKFSADGIDLIYSTYLGGNGSELAHSLIVNSKNELVILGTSASTDFPVSANAYDGTANGGEDLILHLGIDFQSGSDIVLAILSADGSDLIGSTYFGGSKNDGLNTTGPDSLQFNYGDHQRGEVILDASDQIYIASITQSNDLPTTSASFQSSIGGDTDGVVAKFNANASSLLWCSYIGGSDDDNANSLKLDASGNVFITGGTASQNIDLGPGGLDSSYNGGQADGYLIKVNNNGTNILGGTYLGTDQYDQSYFVEIDDEDRIYSLGQTRGTYPTTAGVYKNNNGKQFIHCLNNNLSETEFSTVFGSGGGRIDISPTAFLVDFCQRIYVSGWGGGINNNYNDDCSPSITGLPTTGDAFKSETDGTDFYLLSLDKDAESIIYGSYFGGNTGSMGGEHVDGGTSRFDKDGRVYQAVCASCGARNDIFPTTPGAWSELDGSDNCNLGVFRFDFEPNLLFAATDQPADIIACAPFEITIFDASNRGEEFLWDFGDGTTSTEANPTHLFPEVGMYDIQLIVIDSTTCNITDTVNIAIDIQELDQVVIADFDIDVPGMCEGFTVGITDNSTLQDPDNQYIWTWNYGDGNPNVNLVQDHEYTYSEPGDYSVELIVNSGAPCFNGDTVSYDITILPNPQVEALLEDTGPTCIDQAVNFVAVDNAESYSWVLSDGSTVDGPTASESFPEAGLYEVELIATDLSTCNEVDNFIYEFEIFPVPEPLFSMLLPKACVGEPLGFLNESVGPHGLEYTWTADGNVLSTEVDPALTFFEAGEVELCMTATDTVTFCSESYCELIDVINFDLTMPTAFSPNGDGVNDVLRGIGIAVDQIEIFIYNRYGEMVFDSNAHPSGWNGVSSKGNIQGMSVYAYVLKGINSCGNEVVQYGNVTLIL